MTTDTDAAGAPAVPAASIYQTARWYSEVFEWWVFPLSGKKPRPGSRGFKDATNDPHQIALWFKREDPPNIGVDCGRSKLVVVDVDNPEGFTSLTMLWSQGFTTPRTLTAFTGSGGMHYYYQAPTWELRNTAGQLPGVADKTPGIDLRGVGGYVVAPPSPGYDFMPSHWAAEPAPCPEWLRPLRKRVATVRQLVLSDAYVQAAVDDETGAVASASEGARNDQLNRSAYNLGTLVGAGTLSRYLVEDQLLAAALNTGLDEREARRTITSGLDHGERNPRR